MNRSQHTSEQGTAVLRAVLGNCHDPTSFRKEIFLDLEAWQNIPEHKLPWYDYNHNAEDRTKIDTLQQMIIPRLKRIINTGLTDRQRDIVIKYFSGHYTQVSIAQMLGISQPTVSQHLYGKKRNGKRIGGSIRKIRKIIHRSSCGAKNTLIVDALGQMLDDDTADFRVKPDLIQSVL